MAPHSGNALDHFQHQPTNLHEAMRREIENPTIMREAIMREIEKERIREEIIAEEMTRRRILEYEVRRELLMERQLAKLSGEGFPPFPSPVMSFSPTLPFLKQQSDAGCTEERIARSLEGRMGKEISVSGLGARNEIRRLDIVPFEERISEIPFQQRSVEPKVSALKPVSHSAERMISELQPSLEPSKEKDRIILLVSFCSSCSSCICSYFICFPEFEGICDFLIYCLVLLDVFLFEGFLVYLESSFSINAVSFLVRLATCVPFHVRRNIILYMHKT